MDSLLYILTGRCGSVSIYLYNSNIMPLAEVTANTGLPFNRLLSLVMA